MVLLFQLKTFLASLIQTYDLRSNERSGAYFLRYLPSIRQGKGTLLTSRPLICHLYFSFSENPTLGITNRWFSGEERDVLSARTHPKLEKDEVENVLLLGDSVNRGTNWMRHYCMSQKYITINSSQIRKEFFFTLFVV